MDIDAYQQCPCHSEKKIKFCCGKEIVSDLNQILAKNSAGQGLAALEQLERVIKKTGPRDCLLTIQTHILIAHGELEKAKQSNELFMQNNPHHATGLHHQALIRLSENDVAGAVESLQDAMDAITGNEIPLSMAQAFRMVGLGLLQEGHLVGARAHLSFAQYLKNGNDKELAQMLFETYRLSDAPILLKQEFVILTLDNADQASEWGNKYANVQRAIDRGQFRKALKFLKKIDTNFPPQKAVVRGIAVMNMQLGYSHEIADAWRRYSQMEGVSELAAIEAEALAQLFRVESSADGSGAPEIDIMRITYDLSDFSIALESALSNDRLATADSVSKDPFGEGPAPRNSFLLLDKKLVSVEELGIENVSNISSELLMFGKQTDRPARLEWVVPKRDIYESDRSFIAELFADVVIGEPTEKKIGSVMAATDALTWNWQLPQGVTYSQHANLVKQKYQEVLQQKWAHIPMSELDGKTPAEAVGVAELQIPLQALLVSLEFSLAGQSSDSELIDGLRKSWGLKSPELMEYAPSDSRVLSPLEQRYLRINDLTDEQLVKIQAEAMTIGNLKVLRPVLEEILKRPDLEGPSRDVIYSMLAQLTDDEDQGLQLLAKARTEAKALNRPIGVYLVQEFEFRLSRGLTEKLPALMQTIQMHHLDDPEVEYHLARVLERYGLLQGQPGEASLDSAESGMAAEANQGAFWGNEGAGTSAAMPTQVDSGQNSGENSGETDSPSKLWIPE